MNGKIVNMYIYICYLIEKFLEETTMINVLHDMILKLDKNKTKAK